MKKYFPVLQKSVLFKNFTDEELSSTLGCLGAYIVTVRRNSLLEQAGTKTDCVGLILSGTALVIQNDIWGNRNILSCLAAGDIYAEPFAIIPDMVLNIDVVATDDCTVLKINASRLLTTCHNACSHHNRLVINFVNVLAARTLMLNEKITHISHRKTRDKLLSYLSTQAVKNKSLDFYIPYDRQQLADYLGVERAAMSTELSRLQKEGYLTTKGKHFMLRTDNYR